MRFSRLLRVSAAFLFSLAIAAGPQANAEGSAEPSLQRCAELLEECFSYTDTDRTSCFYSSSNHSYCSGSILGKLSHQRWSLAPLRIPGEQNHPAFLGPQRVDSTCLANFDNMLFGKLVEGPLSDGAVEQLQGILNDCRRDSVEGLPRL